jgi:hypothetical protein
MDDAPAARTGRFGGIFTALVVLGSFVGVIGWYLATNREGGAKIDVSGFDLNQVEGAKRAPVAAISRPESAPSSLNMLKGEKGMRFVDSNTTAPPSNSTPDSSSNASPAQKAEAAHLGFQEAARKHEAAVRSFGERMTRKYPVIRAYGKDWMSHPDLKKLNDDYVRDKDPIAFLRGLAKSPNLGPMVRKYASSPEIREFIVDGMRQAPGELTSSALDVLQNDRTIKDVVAGVAAGLGLPPSVTGLINGGGDPSKIDQNKIMSDIMKDPQMQKALPH